MATERRLGAVHAAALVVASMVGTGVFTVTGSLLASLPSAALVLAAWAIAGVLALCGAAVYAELGTMMPRVGGEYVYVSRAFGPAAGFLSGWVALIVGFAAPTAVGALGFASYVHAVVPALPQTAVAVALIVIATAVHMIDVRFGARVQAGLAGLVVVLIIVFIAAALATGRLAAVHLGAAVPVARPASGGGVVALAAAFAIGLVQVSYAYSGWNGAAYIAGEVRDPARALPRALVMSTGLVTLLYLSLNVVFLAAVPPAALAGQINVAHIAAGALFGADGGRLRQRDVDVGAAGRRRDGRGRRLLPRARAQQRARRSHPRRGIARRARDRGRTDGRVRSLAGLRRLHADAERCGGGAGGVRAAAARAGGRSAAPRARLARLRAAVPRAVGVHDRARGARAPAREPGRPRDAGGGRSRLRRLASATRSDMMSSPR